MMNPALLLLLTLLAQSCSTTKNITSRIVGGLDVTIKKFPFMVSLRYNETETNTLNHLCGGTIINEQWILTAAHCVLPPNPAVDIIFAGTTNKFASPKYILKAESIIAHQYNEDGWLNDIALIKLKEPIPNVPEVRPIFAMEKTYKDYDQDVITLGWGLEINHYLADRREESHTWEEYMGNGELAYVELEMNENRPTQIITGRSDKRGTAVGDSGGPLLIREKENYKIIGVTSFFLTNFYGMRQGFTRVSAFYDWIQSNMK